ncbi:hypothetical protein BH10PSE16_BH10PSE16_12710 [soil metagenome]
MTGLAAPTGKGKIAIKSIAVYARPACANSQFHLISYLAQTHTPRVIPAKAGIQQGLGMWHWIPAFAGMTVFII